MNRSVLVTGGRKGGIGHAIARQFAVHQGDRVLVCDKDEAAGSATVEELRSQGGQVEFVKADVTDPSQVALLLDRAAELGGSLDIVINNAGSAGRAPAQDNLTQLTLEGLVELFVGNVGSAFLVTQAAVQRFFLPRREGCAVFLGSLNGMLGCFGQLGYGIAKAALLGMVRILAARYGCYNLRFNAVVPCATRTNSPNWEERKKFDRFWEEHEGMLIPLGRIARPEDVAQAVVLAATHPYLNGVALPVEAACLPPAWCCPALRPRKIFAGRSSRRCANSSRPASEKRHDAGAWGRSPALWRLPHTLANAARVAPDSAECAFAYQLCKGLRRVRLQLGRGIAFSSRTSAADMAE